MTLLAINIAVFLAPYFVLNLQGPLFDHFALSYPGNPNFRPWQLVTSMFLHGGPSHILFNMIGLFSFGIALERLWGWRRFLIFYFVCGIGAGLINNLSEWIQFQSLHERLVEAGIRPAQIQALLTTDQMPPGYNAPEIRVLLARIHAIYWEGVIGASGAIYGLLVGFGLTYPNAKMMLLFLPVPIAAKYLIPILIGIDLMSGVTGFSLFGANIAHFAHIGGAIVGVFLMFAWLRRVPRPAY